jgi:hypothetical protein
LIMGLNRLARIAMITNEFQPARDRSDEAAAIARGLAESDSSDVQAQRQYFLALERAAQASVRMRDLAGAQSRYQQCLAIARVLAADATNIRRQRDVALALSGLGDVMFERGDRTGATPYYVESLDIRRRLAAADASSAELQRDLLVGLDRARHVGVGGIRWADIVAQMEAMERRGMLNPSDRNYLARARLGASMERP